MLYNVVLVSALQQCESAIGIQVSSLLDLPSHLAPYPTPLGCHTAPDLSSMYYTVNFHRLCNFTHIMYVFWGYSLHLAHPLLPSVSTSLFSMTASPLLPYRQVHQYHLSRFHIYIHQYMIFVFLFLYFILYNRL